jgi:thiol-disulfide isomerase/thioredoxin
MAIDRIGFMLAIVVAAAVSAPAGEATKPAGPFPSLEALNAAYERELGELNRRLAADLSAFAAKAKGAEAESAYSQLFHLALTHGICTEAETAAERCLGSPDLPRELRALAKLVRIKAAADRGHDDRALADLKAFLLNHGRGETASEIESALGVGEEFVRRQISAGRYDLAKAVCELACEMEGAPAAIKDHFQTRMRRIQLLGKPAPPIAGSDVDGDKITLAERKGKVVLIDFWATWCPPCVVAIPRLKALCEKYRGKDFEILGVNVDAIHQDVKDKKTALPVVRKFLVEQGVPWANVLEGAGEDDTVKAFGVEDIPATFLVDRTGKVIAFDLSGDELDRAVAKALAADGTGNRP